MSSLTMCVDAVLQITNLSNSNQSYMFPVELPDFLSLLKQKESKICFVFSFFSSSIFTGNCILLVDGIW